MSAGSMSRRVTSIFRSRQIAGEQKKPQSQVHLGCGFEIRFFDAALGLLDHSGFNSFYAHPHAFHLAGGEANFDSLYVGAELAGCGLGDVRADTAAFL